MQSKSALEQLFEGWTPEEIQQAAMEHLPEYRDGCREIDFGEPVGREIIDQR